MAPHPVAGPVGGRSVFTEYVASLSPSAEAPTSESFEEVWTALRAILVRELRRRGLWNAPPSYLGVSGGVSWAMAAARAADDPSGVSTALDELVAACYEFIFVDRLRQLRAHLDRKPNLDGLVCLNVKNFLYDTQKRNDPVGFRAFKVLRAAVREMLAEGSLALEDGDPRVRNETALRVTHLRASAPPTTAATEPLAAIVPTWSGDLLPDLIDGHGRVRDVVSRLKGRIAALDPALGVFRFRELVEPLRNALRRGWADRLAREAGERLFDLGPSSLEGASDPAISELEGRDALAGLVGAVRVEIDRLDDSAKTRDYLHRLLDYLEAHASGGGIAEDDLPSHRRLAGLLSIPRDRLPELFRRLGELCQARAPAKAGRRDVNDQGEGRVPRRSSEGSR